MYLKWNEKTITDFADNNINSLYSEGYVFTRLGYGIMHQTRSLRINLSKFKLSSENRRILKKIEGLNLNIESIPYEKYNWSIGKMAKDFYDTKFKKGTWAANKIKELLTNKKNNFNTLFIYNLSNEHNEKDIIGYTISYANPTITHYSYPFYKLGLSTEKINNIGMGMMIMAITAAKQNDMQYIYLGSAQRPKDVYKLQFTGLEWFDGTKWRTDLDELKNILKQNGK